jgi:oligoribonuclease
MPEAKDHLVWLDMEMTGLDPERNVPVQVAMIITTAELVELEAIEITIWQPEEALLRMEPIVRKMHTDNGLLDKIRSSNTSVLQAERKLLELLARWLRPIEGVLCGNSIHQDRRFLDRYFPAVNGYLHYRMVDVSTLKELAKRWYGSDALYQKASADHTALSDIRESIRELQHYRTSILKPAKNS